MGFIIARVAGVAIGLALALAAFILQLLIRKVKLPVIVTRIIAAAGLVFSLYTVITTVVNLLKFHSRLISVITVSAPLILYALGAAILFCVIFLNPHKPKPAVVTVNLAVTLFACLQFCLHIFNLVRNWKNFSVGMTEWRTIQILVVVIAAVTLLLFVFSYRGVRRWNTLHGEAEK
ncbi:hypothetical protein FACS1894130_10660 [Spirochaetia bacterium]|nr:hypothetical protein FACS1894130_10660 [Spirochaetia bacterium]